MKYKFTIPGRLDGLNEYTSANRRNPYAGMKAKHNNEELIIWAIRRYLRGVRIKSPVMIYYRFFEPNRRRDNDNILSCAAKFVQDSLVKTQVLPDDSQKIIKNFCFDTYFDKKNPRIEVEITELSKEQENMTIRELIKEGL